MSNASSPVAVSGGHSLTIAEFCAAERMSRPFYFKLRQRGKGPRELREGRFVRITPEAHAEWRRQRTAQHITA